MQKIKLIFNKSELGAGTRGASLGIDALKIASLSLGSRFFFDREIIEIENDNKFLFEQEQNASPDAIRIDLISKHYERITNQLSIDLIKESYCPIFLSGDHSSAGAYIAAIKSAYPKDRIGVVWIDAHADLHTPYTSPSGNMHGMPLSAALGIDNTENRRNNISNETADYWNIMKNVGGFKHKIKPQDVVFLGLRDSEKEERAFKKQYGIKTFKVSDVRKYGAEQIAGDIIEYLDKCDKIFVSFDVDSLDPKLVSEGTGTPVKNGFSESEASRLINTILRTPKAFAFEVVEVNPLLDNKGNEMAETAFRILERAVGIMETRL